MLAVIVGIGTTLFSEFTKDRRNQPSLEDALDPYWRHYPFSARYCSSIASGLTAGAATRCGRCGRHGTGCRRMGRWRNGRTRRRRRAGRGGDKIKSIASGKLSPAAAGTSSSGGPPAWA
jgi:hypothetical protein